MHEVVCRAGPSDRPFEERHDGFSISAVVQGSFTYRSEAGVGLLYPGALLLGNNGRCFECGHEHGVGDRCVSLNIHEDLFGEISAVAASASGFCFSAPSLPPSPKALPVVALMEALSLRAPALRREELVLGSSSALSPQWPSKTASPLRRPRARRVGSLKRSAWSSPTPPDRSGYRTSRRARG